MLNFNKVDPLFICGHRACGSGLYVGLLDFHPELLVYPNESKFFYLFYPIISNKKISLEKKVNYIIENNFKFLKSGFFEKCKADKKYFDFEKFIEIFKKEALKKNKNDWRSLLLAIFKSYAQTTPQKKTKIKYWVEKTSSSEIYITEIKKKFPKAKFIHCIRDPRDNYASMKSRWSKKLKDLTDTNSLEALRQSCIQRGKLGFDLGISNQKVVGRSNYLFSKYDDLVLSPKENLNIISNFLDIDPKLFILKPTFCGLNWPGNNFEDKSFKNISKNQSDSWSKRITDFEGALIEFHFKDYMDYFGYEKSFSEKERMEAASEHYKWLNYRSPFKADFKHALKAHW